MLSLGKSCLTLLLFFFVVHQIHRAKRPTSKLFFYTYISPFETRKINGDFRFFTRHGSLKEAAIFARQLPCKFCWMLARIFDEVKGHQTISVSCSKISDRHVRLGQQNFTPGHLVLKLEKIRFCTVCCELFLYQNVYNCFEGNKLLIGHVA